MITEDGRVSPANSAQRSRDTGCSKSRADPRASLEFAEKRERLIGRITSVGVDEKTGLWRHAVHRG